MARFRLNEPLILEECPGRKIWIIETHSWRYLALNEVNKQELLSKGYVPGAPKRFNVVFSSLLMNEAFIAIKTGVKVQQVWNLIISRFILPPPKEFNKQFCFAVKQFLAANINKF